MNPTNVLIIDMPVDVSSLNGTDRRGPPRRLMMMYAGMPESMPMAVHAETQVYDLRSVSTSWRVMSPEVSVMGEEGGESAEGSRREGRCEMIQAERQERRERERRRWRREIFEEGR